MKKKFVGLIFLVVFVSSVNLPLAKISASTWPNLPPGPVQQMVKDSTDYYFVSTLSGIPDGFDIVNGGYNAWCIERGPIMERDVPQEVRLYSSLSPPTILSAFNWVAINYVLNHKQGTAMDVQMAIWYFTNGSPVLTADALAMIHAAFNHPNYDPASGRVLAVICLHPCMPGAITPGAQNTVIEFSRPATSLSPFRSPFIN